MKYQRLLAYNNDCMTHWWFAWRKVHLCHGELLGRQLWMTSSKGLGITVEHPQAIPTCHLGALWHCDQIKTRRCAFGEYNVMQTAPASQQTKAAAFAETHKTHHFKREHDLLFSDLAMHKRWWDNKTFTKTENIQTVLTISHYGVIRIQNTHVYSKICSVGNGSEVCFTF